MRRCRAATAEARSYSAEGALAYEPMASWLRSDALAGHLGRLDPARRGELARLLPELRPAEADPPPARPVHDLLTGLRALDRVAEVEVGRLSEQEMAALAERLARHPLGEAEAGRLFAETEGNPLFVVEALRAGWSGQDAAAPISPRVRP